MLTTFPVSIPATNWQKQNFTVFSFQFPFATFTSKFKNKWNTMPTSALMVQWFGHASQLTLTPEMTSFGQEMDLYNWWRMSECFYITKWKLSTFLINASRMPSHICLSTVNFNPNILNFINFISNVGLVKILNGWEFWGAQKN